MSTTDRRVSRAALGWNMQRLSTLVVVTLCVVGCGGSAEPAGAGSDAGADLPAASDPTGPTV